MVSDHGCVFPFERPTAVYRWRLGTTLGPTGTYVFLTPTISLSPCQVRASSTTPNLRGGGKRCLTRCESQYSLSTTGKRARTVGSLFVSSKLETSSTVMSSPALMHSSRSAAAWTASLQRPSWTRSHQLGTRSFPSDRSVRQRLACVWPQSGTLTDDQFNDRFCCVREPVRARGVARQGQIRRGRSPRDG